MNAYSGRLLEARMPRAVVRKGPWRKPVRSTVGMRRNGGLDGLGDVAMRAMGPGQTSEATRNHSVVLACSLIPAPQKRERGRERERERESAREKGKGKGKEQEREREREREREKAETRERASSTANWWSSCRSTRSSAARTARTHTLAEAMHHACMVGCSAEA